MSVSKVAVNKPLLDVLHGNRRLIPPVWMMRQAGRYLPEYRAVREQAGSFLKLCFTPRLAAEVTMQPVRRFGFDAAILFSDILVVPHALGRHVAYLEGEGPRLEPLDLGVGLSALRRNVDQDVLRPVYETIGLVKAELPANVTLLGFCGAPWTVATYMVAGQGSMDQAVTRLAAYQRPQAFAELIEILVEASVDYLMRQFEAGADAVQIFDTWAGVLPPEEFRRWCVEPTRKIVENVRKKISGARIIGFPRGAGSLLPLYVEETGVSAVGLDWMVDKNFAREQIQRRIPVQGNLDPLALLAGGEALDAAVDAVIDAFAGAPFIFNLGHGILPETPITHVERMLACVRQK